MIYGIEMRVREIGEVVIRYVRTHCDDSTTTLVRRELGICLGETRVDIAVVNGALTGWEIKSAQDRLVRLSHQASVYSKVLDRAIVIADVRHLGRVALHVPEWWGIARVDRTDEVGSVTFLRSPEQNPTIDPFSLAQLVWRDEAYRILEGRELHRGMRKATRWKLWQELAASLSLDELRLEVRETLKARQIWLDEARRSRDGELSQSGAR
jgi:hypothetical protein